MRRSLSYHPRFAVVTAAPRDLSADANIIRLRIDEMPWHGRPLRVMSALVRDNAGFVPLVAIEIYDDAILAPRAYERLDPTLRSVLGLLEPWIDGNPSGTPTLKLADDPLIDAVDFDVLAVPGVSSLDVLLDATDRYRAVAAHAAGRTTCIFAPGVAFGTGPVSAVAASVTVVPTDPILAAAFDVGVAENADLPVQCGLAIGIPDAIAPAVATAARTAIGAAGTLVLSTRGPRAETVLRDLGFEPRPLARLAMDALSPFVDEYIGVRLGTAPDIAAVARVPAPHAPARVAERPIRVLFVLRASADAAFGGDVLQVRRTADCLRARGHDAQITTASRPEAPSDCDVVHLTNLTVPAETLGQANAVERFGGVVALMPIFTDHADETAWGIQVWPQLFTMARDDEQLTSYFTHLAARHVNASFAHHGGLIAPPARIDMVPNYTAMQRAILERCDYVIANAHAEMHRVYRYLDATVPYAIAPSAADPTIYRPQAADAFRAKYDLGDYVVTTGRIEARKNQLLLAYALASSGRRLVVVGKNHTASQAHLLHAYLGANVVLFGEMPETELAGVMAAARVVAMPSWDEVVSLSSLNAAACGTSIVLTRNSYEHEYLRDDAEYCDPGDIASIAAAVERAWTTHESRAERRAALSERVRREYTWEASAAATEDAYYRVLASNPRGDARRARFGAA